MAGGRSSGAADTRVCLGVVVGAHGVRGVLRIKPFTEDPEAVGAYGPLESESGDRRFELKVHGMHKGVVLAEVPGVADRDAALALKGARLYVDRAVLPEPEEDDSFYYADLLGLAVEDTQGTPLGRVVGVDDHGAGDVIEIAAARGPVRVLPFTKAVVPTVDLAGGRLVVDPPPEQGEPEAGAAADVDPKAMGSGEG
jgi:16S rRNA processing protein RimM